MKNELKAFIRKNALSTLEKKAHPEALYSLVYRQRVKKFFAITYKQQHPIAEEQKKEDKELANRPPAIREHDLVLAFPSDSENIEQEHMLCVVDSL